MHTEPAIPDGIDGIDDDWLSQAIGAPIRAVSIEDIGTGVGMIGALYRATLEGDGPDSVVIKLPGLDETARFTAAILRLNIREVGFYRELADESPIRVPACHFGAVDTETHQFVLVLEDVGSCRAVDQIQGMGRADAEQAVDELAAWHAHWWGAAGPIVERGTAVTISDPIYPMLLPPVFSDGWGKVRAAMSVPRSVEMVADGWVEALPRMLQSMASTASHPGPRRLPGRQHVLRRRRPCRAVRLPGHRGVHAGGRSGLLRHREPRPRHRLGDRAGPVRALAGRPGRRKGVPESDTAGLWDRNTAARCCSASATR